MNQTKLGPAIPQLPTGDIEKTAVYFSERLGFEIAGKYPEQKFLIVKRGPAEIHFWQAPSEKEARDLGSVLFFLEWDFFLKFGQSVKVTRV